MIFEKLVRFISLMAFPHSPPAAVSPDRPPRLVVTLPLFLVMSGLLLCGCSDPEEVLPEETSDACSASSDSFLQLGRIVDAEFVEFQEADEFELEFASQSGMEGAVSLRSSGMTETEIVQITCQILFEGAPLGEAQTSSKSLVCDEETGVLTLQASILIDVGAHPTVTSVAQVDGKIAQLHVVFEGATGLLAEQTIAVTLAL